MLRRILDEPLDIVALADDDQVVRVKTPQMVPCNNLRNPADPDSSYNKHRGQNYLAQVMETHHEDDAAADESPVNDSAPRSHRRLPDLITQVSVVRQRCQRLDDATIETADTTGLPAWTGA